MNQLSAFRLSMVALFAALNAGVGFIVQLLKLPIYLDLIGSVLAVVLLGPVYGIAVAVLGIILLGLLTVPTAFAYVGTAVVVTLFAYVFHKYGYLKKWPQTIAFGLVLGIISAVMSAPVTVYLFGGISFVGADAATAFFRATGKTIFNSVFLGGLATDPVDKVLLSIICFVLIQRLPERLKERLSTSNDVGAR
jgi:energy-coupling factor transport system substrate-specific component